MVNYKGIASYCQDCGLCSVSRPGLDDKHDEASLIDIIVNEVVRTVSGKVPFRGAR